MKAKIMQMFLMKRPNSKIRDVIAKHLIKKHNFKTIPGKTMNEIYIYEGGIFVEKGKDIIEEESEKILEEMSSSHMIKEIKNKIERLTKVDRKKMGCNDYNLICLNNGVLNLKTNKLSAHAEQYRFMSKIPINYVSEAYCETIFNFLHDVFLEEDMDCIQEWIGYHLYREYFIKKAVIFRGEPDTGKTTFMNLLKSFIGEENYSGVSLQLLSQGKWQLVPLYNKHANICDDLSEKDITDSGTFKQVTGRSPIDAEIKFGGKLSFENYAKLNFACNKIPAINSDIDDKAYWDRWLIFDFDNVFDKKNKYTDNKIIHKIVTDNELSGLLNWAIEGFKRIKKQGYFSYRRNWEKNRRIMQGESSSVARFVNDCLLYSVEDWVSNKELYDNYVEYCGLNDITPDSDQKFAKDIRKYCNFGKFGINRGNIFGIKGVKIKEVFPIMGLRI